MRRRKRAAVLGCGPAGLFTAHALVENGWDIGIFSKKRRSEMFGAQYLHMPIPHLAGDTEPKSLQYKLVGTNADYQRKVYGSREVPFVSPQDLAGDHMVWDIRRAYYDAWDRYAWAIEDTEVGIDWMMDEVGRWDRIFTTIPADRLCYQGHVFTSQSVWAIGDAPERGIFCPVEVPAFEVVCNGETSPGWYRASNVFGYKTAEWPEGSPPPLKNISEINKPIGTNCNCWTSQSTGVVRVGRYGAWDKRSFSHHGYEHVMQKGRKA